MRDPDATAKVVEAMVEAANTFKTPIPISVKCRVGVAERLEDFLGASASTEDVDAMFARIETFARKCADAGASHVVVHCREAVMSGLSPKANREVPPLRPELAARLASALGASSTAVTLNGGIASVGAAAAALERWPHLQGVAAGRWPLRRPLDMLAVDAVFTSGGIVHGSGGGGGGVGTLRLADSDGAAAAVRQGLTLAPHLSAHPEPFSGDMFSPKPPNETT